jgi:hypothetical protein
LQLEWMENSLRDPSRWDATGHDLTDECENSYHVYRSTFFMLRKIKIGLRDNLAIYVSVCLSVCVSLRSNFEWRNQSLWNLVCISWYLCKSQRHFHKCLPLVISTLQPLKFLRQNLSIAWTPVPTFRKLGMYIMPHEAI